MLAASGSLVAPSSALASPGAPDPDFSGDGKARISTYRTDWGEALAIDSYGRVVVAGSFEPGSAWGKFQVVRLRPNGSRDRTFSGDGIRRLNFTDGYDAATSVALQRDGKIIVAGFSPRPGEYFGENRFALARLNPNGSLDGSFGGGDGKVVVNFP